MIYECLKRFYNKIRFAIRCYPALQYPFIFVFLSFFYFCFCWWLVILFIFFFFDVSKFILFVVFLFYLTNVQWQTKFFAFLLFLWKFVRLFYLYYFIVWMFTILFCLLLPVLNNLFLPIIEWENEWVMMQFVSCFVFVCLFLFFAKLARVLNSFWQIRQFRF